MAETAQDISIPQEAGAMTDLKVCIVGLHPAHRDLAPWDDPSWEVWAINESLGPKFSDKDGVPFIHRWTRWFQLHTPDIFDRPENWNDEGHPAWLRSLPGPDSPDYKPLYMIDKYPDIPASVKYPIDAIKEKLELDGRTTFFSATVPHLISFALYLDAKAIMLRGVEAASETEYGNERDSLSFWLGFAKGYGAKIDLPDNCQLLGAGRAVYGYEGLTGITKATLAKRLEIANARTQKAIEAMPDLKTKRDDAASAAQFNKANKELRAAASKAQEELTDALCYANVCRGIAVEDNALLDMMLSSKMEILTSVIMEGRQNQFEGRENISRAKLNSSFGKRDEVYQQLAKAQNSGDKKRLRKRRAQMDEDVMHLLAEANVLSGLACEDACLRRIANGLSDDLEPPLGRAMVRMRQQSSVDRPGIEWKPASDAEVEAIVKEAT